MSASILSSRRNETVSQLLFGKQEKADLQIKYGGDKLFHGHKFIICSRSRWFARAVKGQNDVVTITLDKEDNPMWVLSLLTFVYNVHVLPNRPGLNLGVPIDAARITHLYLLAEKYEVETLKDYLQVQMGLILDAQKDKTPGLCDAVKLSFFGPRPTEMSSILSTSVESFLPKLVASSEFRNIIGEDEARKFEQTVAAAAAAKAHVAKAKAATAAAAAAAKANANSDAR